MCRLRIKELFDTINKALGVGVKPLDIVNIGLLEGMKELSSKVSKGEAFSADIINASSAVNLCCRMLIGDINKELEPQKLKTVVTGTVKGDIHDIGKNIIKYLLRMQGIKVLDLGCNVSKENFLRAALEDEVGMVICSGTLQISANELKGIVDEIKSVKKDLYIFAGGAAFNSKIVNEAGADGYFKNIDDAVEITVTTLKALISQGGD